MAHALQTPLKSYFLDLMKAYKRYIVAMVFIALYWAINNSFTPFVLKMIIDKTVAFSGDKAALLQAVKPYIILYVTLCH